MFKGMKLATKLAMSFGVMVVIAGVLGYMGWSSLGTVVARVENADDANRLLKFAKDCRIQEKNFIMRGDKKFQEENDETMAAIYKQIDETKAKFRDPADINTITEVKGKGQAYKKSFDGWIDLWEKQQKNAEAMVTNARAFLDECEAMRVKEKADAAVVLDVQASIAAGSRDHLVWANAVKDFLSDKSATLDVQTDGHQCAFGKWLESAKFAEQLPACGQQFREIMDEIKQKHLGLHASAIDVQKARTTDSDTSLDLYKQKTAPLLKDNLEAFAKLEEIISARVIDKLGKADDANRLIKWAKDTRIQEKNFMMRGDKKYQTENDATMKSIYGLCDDLNTRFMDPKNREQVATIRAAAEKYKENFDGWISQYDQQKKEEEAMVAAARDFGSGSDELRQGQKEKMTSAAAFSTQLMLILAAAGVILGTILAFVITRGITKPL
ncbi:MAG: methyl-accepting chemotaxis protein, partial [Phycisphaerae bacterium]